MLRRVQMSQADVIVFVEGRELDQYFYDHICQTATQEHPFTYQVFTAQVLEGHSGGKSKLAAFHDYLRRRAALLNDFEGSRTGCVFFVDKDVDDILRRRKRSLHFVYTEYYDAQNHVFLNGDLMEAAAQAACAPRHSLPAQLQDSVQWCRAAAERWRDWVEICYLASTNGVPGEPNYRIHSPINAPSNSGTDLAAKTQRLESMRQRMGLQTSEFAEMCRRAARRIAEYYRTGQQDALFKGKWYDLILRYDVQDALAGCEHDANNLQRGLTMPVAGTLDYAASWADHFRMPLLAIARQVRP
jgi:hypothetical protein